MRDLSLPRHLVLLLAAASAALCASSAAAQDYPARPVRIIVPFATGGGSDTLARLVGQKLSTAWKQPVVVENRPGAGGALGADLVAKAAPDGYTLLVSDSSAVTMNPWLYPKLPYAAKDLTPVVQLATFALVLVVPATSPANKVSDLVAADRKKPGSLSGASSGNGTSPHLVLEMVNLGAGTSFVHVPYKGGGPAMVDIIGGQVDFIFNGLGASTMPMITGGKVKALAVTTAQRIPSLPQVPTMNESGFPGFEAVSAQSLFVPAGTPPAVVRKLNADIGKILREPEVVERWNQAGYLPVGDETPEQLGSWFAKESAKWGRIVRERNVKVD
ncbi:MAG: tripartite tricarboxylate transporter substrate binding protein [Ramlibacter sp.]|nr:tripartite tricarboxylate transporter substrate binding protein [Ramlibacter sp.]